MVNRRARAGVHPLTPTFLSSQEESLGDWTPVVAGRVAELLFIILTHLAKAACALQGRPSLSPDACPALLSVTSLGREKHTSLPFHTSPVPLTGLSGRSILASSFHLLPGAP